MDAADMLLRSAARWLLVVLPLGVWLRSAFVWAHTPGPFTWANLIHAHSHTAYFGWAGLGLMGLMLAVLPRLTGRPVADSAPLRWLLWLAPWAVGGALVTFAWQGYGGLSIAFSTVNYIVAAFAAKAVVAFISEYFIIHIPSAHIIIIRCAVYLINVSLSNIHCLDIGRGKQSAV